MIKSDLYEQIFIIRMIASINAVNTVVNNDSSLLATISFFAINILQQPAYNNNSMLATTTANCRIMIKGFEK